jgi:hypothetical protein
MPTDADYEALAYNLSTWTIDLALPNEPVKWGHLSPESCRLLTNCVKAWMGELIDGSGGADGD